ncbi:hypothetical protein FJZ48_01670 [Candidatus Uhrbacteria bacterium]|nr:hypothetical protein [Candidatus Uhrbacteria bacterium]
MEHVPGVETNQEERYHLVMNHFLIFGTHPFLSLAEAKAVIGGRRPDVADGMAVFDMEQWDGGRLQDVLAGTVKLGDVLWEGDVKDCSAEVLAKIVEEHPRAKKVEFGLTVFGASSAQKERMKKLPLSLKRVLQEQGRSVRWVTGEKGEVTPAAVAKAGLTTAGYDFCIGIFGARAVVGLTTFVQDADAWSLRDFGRPFRDEVVGMLPPKLARMMVNLSGVASSKHQVASILDPFCGGGTVLMEADHLGIKELIGSDIDQTQIDGARKNVQWLKDKALWKGKEPTWMVRKAEEIDQHMKQPVSAVVTEGYLGKPLTGHETLKTLTDQKNEIENLWRSALRALEKILRPGGLVVCVWPVWVSSHGTVAVDISKDLSRLGYKKIDPLAGWTDKPVTLTYARPDQRVKRNIMVLEKI